MGFSGSAADVKGALRSEGFAVISGASPGELQKLAIELGKVRTSSERLEATERTVNGKTLTDLFGKEEFPWHSDGAISLNPPRYLVMYSEGDDRVEPTEILFLGSPLLDPLAGELSRTVLLISTPGGKRYGSAFVRSASHSIVRWDERMCSPINSRSARAALEVLTSIRPTGTINWAPKVSAIIDNHASLHRRPSITSSARVLRRLYVY